MLGGMSSVPLLYRAAVRAMRRSSSLLAYGDSKLARGIRGRRTALDALRAWGSETRDPTRPTVWFHAPSVGEGLQAGAVMQALSIACPDVQLAFTHFSPSAEGLGARLGAQVEAYLPWDLPEAADEALDALRPRLLVFTKTEVWPVLVEAAARRGIPLALAAGSVRADSGRMRWPARTALRSTWERLSAVGACTAADAERLLGLGVPESALHVTGDPGVDSAAGRAATADPEASYLAPFHAAGRPVLVAGSTWPEDEAVLIDAWEGLRHAAPEALLVVVPHEPTPEHVHGVLGRLREKGLRTVTIGVVERAGSVGELEAVVVDRVGILAHLYGVATAAYVGGGFGRDGLHSVLEPAAAGVPVLFGPRHHGARAATDLVQLGAARIVEDAGAAEDALLTWLTAPDSKTRASERALDYIGAHRGAAERTARLLEPLIDTEQNE